MLLFASLFVRVSAVGIFSEMGVFHVPISDGVKTDLTFPVPNTIVVFGSTHGYNALFGVGQSYIRHFGSVHQTSNVVGVFFGASPGKIRINGHSNLDLVLYVLIPPAECDTFYVTTAPTEFFSIGTPIANVTDGAESRSCLWRVHPSTFRYRARSENLQPRDSFRVHSTSLSSGDLTRITTIASNVAITFFRYWRSGHIIGRFAELEFTGINSDPFPSSHGRFPAGGKPDILRVDSGPVVAAPPDAARPPGVVRRQKSYAVRLSYISLMMIVVTIGLCLIVLIFSVVLIVGRCTSKPPLLPAKRHERQQSEVLLLGPFAGSRFSEDTGIPIVFPLTQGSAFGPSETV
jgi:hypothetical protein